MCECVEAIGHASDLIGSVSETTPPPGLCERRVSRCVYMWLTFTRPTVPRQSVSSQCAVPLSASESLFTVSAPCPRGVRSCICPRARTSLGGSTLEEESRESLKRVYPPPVQTSRHRVQRAGPLEPGCACAAAHSKRHG